MLDRIRSLIPLGLKSVTRRAIIDPVRRRLHDRDLGRLLNDLRKASTVQRGTLEAIRLAWGNESFSADIDYMVEMVSRIEKCRGPILECGSGVTTVVAGVMAGKRNLKVWSLEQDYNWSQFIELRLRKNNIHNVELMHRPLRRYDDFVWYEIDNLTLPMQVDLVLCDGPAVFQEWGKEEAQWRYGVVPILAKRGATVREILLDDATEPRAQNLLQRWRQEFGMESRMIRTSHGDCAVVSRNNQRACS
jgi:hypothetical protein